MLVIDRVPVTSGKNQLNFKIPQPLLDEFHRVVEGNVADKKKWYVAAAALAMLIEAGKEKQRHYIRMVHNADCLKNGFTDLAKRLAAEAGDDIEVEEADPPEPTPPIQQKVRPKTVSGK